MRYEQIIAAVTRTLVIRTVRELEAVRLFVRTIDLHLCYLRKHGWKPAMADVMRAWSQDASFADDVGGIRTGMMFTGPINHWSGKLGRLQVQPALVPASSPARLNRV